MTSPRTSRASLLMMISMPGLALSMTAPRVAVAEEPATPCEVCVTRRVLVQCRDDAQRVDGLTQRVVSCQRQVDAQTGARDELARQMADVQAAVRAQEQLHAQRVAELERRPTWRMVVIVGGAGVVAGAAGLAIWQATR